MSEDDLIARIRRLFPRAGDDCAVVGRQVLTMDMLVEGVDFTPDFAVHAPARLLARKSLAVNLSDLAAMGAKPTIALVAMGGPDERRLGELIEELAVAARGFGIEIVGGDLSRAETLVIAVTALGEVDRPLLRSGARRGDRIYVSRPLGGAAAGLHFLQHPPENPGFAMRELIESAIRRQLDPEPEVELGQRLVGIATACIDISDGLSTDLHHICDASGCGAEIERIRIPVFPDLQGAGPQLGVDVRNAVLHGGEEYALLFTSPLRESELSARTGRPVYAIGRIVEEKGVRLDGEQLPPRGWDHFSR
jgi:thiamine-monophosphate kinase